MWCHQQKPPTQFDFHGKHLRTMAAWVMPTGGARSLLVHTHPGPIPITPFYRHLPYLPRRISHESCQPPLSHLVVQVACRHGVSFGSWPVRLVDEGHTNRLVKQYIDNPQTRRIVCEQFPGRQQAACWQVTYNLSAGRIVVHLFDCSDCSCSHHPYWFT